MNTAKMKQDIASEEEILRLGGLWVIYLSVALQPFVGSWPFFSDLILYTHSLDGESARRMAYTQNYTNTE
jgi:hypothetical protein